MRKPLKGKKMVDYLREQIVTGQLTPGMRLPVLRELMVTFDISFNTAKRGLDYLAEMGLIELRAKSGSYVRSNPQVSSETSSGQRRIVVVIPTHDITTSTSGILSTIMLGIQKEAAEKKCILELHFIRVKDIASEHITKISGNADGMLLVGEYDLTLKNINCLVPAVGVCMHNTYDGIISLLDMDYFQAAAVATNYFTDRGVKKVKVVIDPLKHPVYVARACQFINLWQAAGGQAELCDLPSRFDSDFGFWFATGSLLQEAVEIWRKTETGNGTLAKNRVVLGLDGKHLLAPAFEPVPALAVNWQAAGRYALQECLTRIDIPGTSPKRIMLPVNLVIPDSMS
ncbi:MAG: GntR family transcriptional regulator [Victivallaceae bacterium]